MSNILNAIHNLAETKITKLIEHYNNGSGNRVTNVGDALERYIQDLFANTLNEADEEQRNIKISKIFSYQGNTTNPPDSMLMNGDAIEVKKIESHSASLALNSSFPKQKLFNDDSRITPACKTCEDWTEKDIIYAIGHTNKKEVKHLWLVYGSCYCADRSIYENIANKITSGIESIPNVELAKTNELARANKVDPLGITYLRVRGMWGIEHPSKVFKYIYTKDELASFSLTCIMTKEKFESFSKEDRELVLSSSLVKTIEKKIKNPDNPANLIDAILITLDLYKWR